MNRFREISIYLCRVVQNLCLKTFKDLLLVQSTSGKLYTRTLVHSLLLTKADMSRQIDQKPGGTAEK